MLNVRQLRWTGVLVIGLCGCNSGSFSAASSQTATAPAIHITDLQSQANATITALRLANTITGGAMPSSDPLFALMVSKAQVGDIQGAATIAATSPYFGSYLARRLALEMQTPSLLESNGADNDSTAFIIAHFTGTATTSPSISTLFSENATYMVVPTTAPTPMAGGTPMHAADLTATQLDGINWSASLTQVSGQSDAGGTQIPQKHVGGFVTLSDRANDSSFAMYGATAGTNLRMIEGIWEISTGLQLVDVESTQAVAQNAPRFVPEYNPNFFHGQGQTACIACHGGGMSSLNHGYSTVADVFNFDPQQGFMFISSPTVSTMKSLGSDPNQRSINNKCNLAATPTPVCNPDSLGADPNQGWDVSVTWASTGVLNMMGWRGPTSGQGLNALGSAIGQSDIVYQFLTNRVIQEICPLGTFTNSDVAQIAAAADPYASPPGTDDIRTIVSLVASNSGCL